MELRPTREEAARTLGVSAAAPAVDVKRAYRQRVRDHHPDAGGDPEAFQRIQRAYERLVAAEHDDPPLVARGRPSRAPAPFTRPGDDLDLAVVDWSAPAPVDGDALAVDRLARWLVADDTLVAVRATSRAPGSRLNRVARHLATGFTSSCTIAPAGDGTALGIEVVAATRRARRRLEHVGAEDGWVRTRGSSTTSLRATIPPGRSPRATALRAATELGALLEGLAWPLDTWRADRHETD